MMVERMGWAKRNPSYAIAQNTIVRSTAARFFNVDAAVVSRAQSRGTSAQTPGFPPCRPKIGESRQTTGRSRWRMCDVAGQRLRRAFTEPPTILDRKAPHVSESPPHGDFSDTRLALAATKRLANFVEARIAKIPHW